MYSSLRMPITIGAVIGMITSIVLFNTSSWYHDIFVWSWSNPVMWILGIPVGIVAAVVFDND